jgi:hypothetical protein
MNFEKIDSLILQMKDELIAELRQHNAFWRKLSTGLIGFLGVILVWLAVSKVIG